MKVFDQIDPMTLERRQWHLWLLALTVILILVVGLALLMYPTVFAHPVVLSGPTQRKVFFSFCALSILLLGYLVDRQIVITALRKQLAEEQKRITQVRHEASKDLLATLPGFEHFRDRLTMECRRAISTQQALSLEVVVLKPSRSLAETKEVLTAFGDAAKALIGKLRGEDSMYVFAPGVFCILLPGVDSKNAYRLAERLNEGLGDASGASARFSFDVQVISYPEHATSAREIEEAVRTLFPGDSWGLHQAGMGATPTTTP